MTRTPFIATTSLLDRAAALLAAGMITFSVLGSLGAIADRQVDETLMAQGAAATQTA